MLLQNPRIQHAITMQNMVTHPMYAWANLVRLKLLLYFMATIIIAISMDINNLSKNQSSTRFQGDKILMAIDKLAISMVIRYKIAYHIFSTSIDMYFILMSLQRVWMMAWKSLQREALLYVSWLLKREFNRLVVK
jgi:hypothetical protein